MVYGLHAADRVVTDPAIVGMFDGEIAYDHGTQPMPPTGGPAPDGGPIRSVRPVSDTPGVPTHRFSRVPGDPS